MWTLINAYMGYFNPHSRTGSDSKNSRVFYRKHYFNPHSRKGSDSHFIYPFFFNGISIHTPARGVTFTCEVSKEENIISIHTPARGVTFVLNNNCMFFLNFNPHSRKGSDFWCNGFCSVIEISIHTPARGVTVRLLDKITQWHNFNPHSRKGSDSVDTMTNSCKRYFNPHSRKGSDRKNAHKSI